MKTSKKRYIWMLTGLLCCLQVGCNNVLDLEPQDQLSDASYWQTPNDFVLASNQFYTFLRSYNDVLFDANGTSQNFHADFKSDLIASQNAFSRGLNTVVPTDNVWNNNYTGSGSNDNPKGVPRGAWSKIRVINYLLAKAQAYPNPLDVSKSVAEARFFRAYVYFDLLQIYGGVPIIDKLLDPGNAELQAPRNSRDEVTDFILADLNAAIADLPIKTAQAATELGRINKEAAQALLGRVALYEGTWQKFRGNAARATTLLDIAISASEAVITGNQYSLFAPAVLGDSAQKYFFILENQKSNPAGLQKSANNESILANRYEQTLRQSRVNISRTMNNVNPTKNFVDMYLSQDGLPIEKSPLFQGYATLGSEFENRDNRLRYNLKRAGGYYWFGHANWRVDWTGGPADKANANASPFKPYANTLSGYNNQKWIAERQVPDNEESYDYPVIRYAEVLLNYAEAVFERNGSVSDAELDKSLNLVRNRVNKGMPKLSNALVTANGLDMQAEIRRERTIELYLEGFRLDDLKRWHTAVEVLSKPLVGIKWTGTEYQTLWPSQASAAKDANGNIIVDANRSFSEKNYLVPIPSQQIQLNPSLAQNPGWE